MRVYVDPRFINEFLLDLKNSHQPTNFLKSIIEDFSEITWVFDNNVSFEDFEKWENSNSFYTSINSKGSNTILLNQNFIEEIIKCQNEAQIVLAYEKEDWHKQIENKCIVLLSTNYDEILTEIHRNFSFRFIVDEQNNWDRFKIISSPLVTQIFITDKYLISDFLKLGRLDSLSFNFEKLLQKLCQKNTCEFVILIKSKDADYGKIDELKRKLDLLINHIKERFDNNVSFMFINAELDRNFDFHDRNIISNYYIIKSGKGFDFKQAKNLNSEVECYSFLEKWGHDLIRHRKKMLTNYNNKIKTIQSNFTVIN